MQTELERVLMERDDISAEEAAELVAAARQQVAEGEDPGEVLQDEFGLEPDYFLDITP